MAQTTRDLGRPNCFKQPFAYSAAAAGNTFGRYPGIPIGCSDPCKARTGGARHGARALRAGTLLDSKALVEDKALVEEMSALPPKADMLSVGIQVR